MRKRLLRSRSGFEKPESREEAIMQNILGASNVLEPSESNIEEILKSILYNTPYTKEAEFEIEKILLAIKNNGTYDGECESRDLKILFAILNDLDYTEEAESRIEELFIEWLNQRSSIKVLEGVPPLTFISRGLPLINYLIEGNTVQNGTPSPDNPIMPQGCGERTENLFDKELSGANIDAQGKIIPNSEFNLVVAKVTEGETYSVSGVSAVMGFYVNEPELGSRSYNNQRKSIVSPVTIPQGVNYVVYRVSVRPNVAMFNTGSTPLPYEPYGIKIPISSANTTTPVYLGEVQTTRKIRKLVLTGEETWTTATFGGHNGFLTYAPSSQIGTINCICSHYKVVYANENNVMYFIAQPANGRFIIFDDRFSYSDDFKAYLQQQYAAGTPVTIWYILETEETAVVNEPLMKIGDYADTVSMEQAGVQIPTASGSNTLDVDTTVKPSNVYIEYK